MNDDLATWLAALVSLDESGEPLLSTVASASPRISSFGFDPSARAQSPLTVDGVSSFEEQDRGSQQPTQKQKKRRTSKAKDEIEHLRQTVLDLEALMIVHAQRRSVASRVTRSTIDPPDIRVWKGVALRQVQRLRASLHENQDLRKKLQQQFVLSKNMARLVRRAQHTATSQAIYRNPTPLDEATIASKRQELMAALSNVFQYLSRDMASGTPRHEFRSIKKFAKLSDPTVPPGAVLMQSQARRLLPIEHSELGQRLWGQLQDSDASSPWHRIDVQQVERLPLFNSVIRSFEVPTDQGVALFRAMNVRARFSSTTRDITVAVGSLWPDASAPAAIQSAGVNVRAWTMTQPYAASEGVSEVLFNAVTSRNLSFTRPCIAFRESPLRLLDNLVEGAQTYMLKEHDKVLDGVLLAA